MLLMGNSFEDYIKQTITDKFGDISQEIIEKSYLLQYIIKKTKPADKNESKARKGLGTLYAIYVLIQDNVERGYFDGDNKGKYNKYEGARYSVLIEKETEGPLKKVCFLSNQIAALAIQEEQYV